MDININIDTSCFSRSRFARLAFVLGLAAIAVGLTIGAGRETMAHAQPFSVGLITDERTLADKGINWLSYEGLLRAETELGVAAQVYTSTNPADYDLKLGICAADANALCTDLYLNAFQDGAVGGADRSLTSAIKRHDTAVYDVVAQAQAGSFAPGVTLFDLARNGVGFAPFHEADPHVPQSAREALESVRPRILDGRLDVTESCAQNVLYVDGMTGRDEGDCSNPTTPCRTIIYPLTLAAGGDAILVAGGTYTENLVIQDGVVLKGGFSGTPDWTRDVAAHPTILNGSSAPTVWGDWDGNAIRAPAVISDNSQYRMWYDGFNPTRQTWGWAVGTAESVDGKQWAKYSANPIFGPGEPGEWDSSYRGAGSVVQDDGLYRMYYSGNDGELGQTGLATSTDGVYWSIYDGGPVLPAGADGSWDEQQADGPMVLVENRVYRMWYHGCDAGYSACSIGYATSTNGIDWLKYTGNPVLTATSDAASAPLVVWPSVIAHTPTSGTLYEMWYAAVGGVGRATSADGVHWSRDADNPVWESDWTGFPGHRPSVLWDGSLYRMWVGDNGPTGSSINYLESGDGRAWTQPTNSPVLTAGAPGRWGKPVVQYLPGSSGAVLDGFIITGADAEAGAGVRVDGAAVLIAHSVISHNIAMAGNGGGLRAENGAIVRVEDSLIADNWASTGAGVAAESGSHVGLVRTQVVNNKADVSGGGIALANEGSVRAEECSVRANEAYGAGGGVFVADTDTDLILEMSNCVVADNYASDGAGIANGGRAVLMNVTLAGNLCSNVGCAGGLNNAQDGAVASVTNSILWGNGGLDLAGPGLAVNYSDVNSSTTGLPGFGNIAEDPRFVDASGADYHLKAGSAAIDAGTALGAPPQDVDGDLRPLGKGYDMGADEFPLFTTAYPSVTARLTYTDAEGSIIRIEIPTGAVQSATTIAYHPKDPDFVPDIPPGFALGSQPFDLEASQNGLPVTSFDVTITLRIRYADAALINLFENTLALYRRTTQGWEIVGTRPGESYHLDPGRNLLTAYLRGFSRFGNMGAAIGHRLYLPVSLVGVR